jgi:methionyl-tRNA synthetase
MTKKIVVTSALPYANGSIHIGHLVEYIQTDIFVRFLKLIGEDAVYCCADDTHGTPIEIKSKQLGIKPEELIAKFGKEHLSDFKSFLINFDSYYSTNSKENKYFSDLIFSRLKEKGFIYTKKIKITYCEHCKRPLPDRYVKGICPKCGAEEQYGDACEKCGSKYDPIDLENPKCTICGTEPVYKDSEHYFFKLAEFSSKLEKWLTENKNLQPEIRNYILNWVKEGLKDWDISRDGPYFGFKIAGEEDKYYYVWLDAPIGYISSFANYLGKDTKKAEKEWNDSRIIHFIGKDIIYFHFLFWPAMLMGADFNLPENLVVHGFLTVNGEKMSKSRGTFYTAKDFLSKYKNPEYLRYYYAGLLSRKMSDLDLDLENFKKNVNNELVANLSNFCYRVLSFCNKSLDSKITEFDKTEPMLIEIKERIEKIKKNYLDVNLKEALSEIMAISALGNKYFQENEPWKLINEDKEKTEKIITFCVNIAKILSIIVEPVLPKFSEELQKQLKVKKQSWKDLDKYLKNISVGKAEILVKKID